MSRHRSPYQEPRIHPLLALAILAILTVGVSVAAAWGACGR